MATPYSVPRLNIVDPEKTLAIPSVQPHKNIVLTSHGRPPWSVFGCFLTAIQSNL